MAEIIDFHSNPVSYIKRNRKIADHIYELLSLFEKADRETKIEFKESIKHQGDSILLLCTDIKTPLAAWIIKTEEIGAAILPLFDDSIYYVKKPFTILHVTDSDIYGVCPVDFVNALQFSSLLPPADWFSLPESSS